MDPEFIVAIVAVVSLFVVFPGMVFHYITLWRKQKTLEPDDACSKTSGAPPSGWSAASRPSSSS